MWQTKLCFQAFRV